MKKAIKIAAVIIFIAVLGSIIFGVFYIRKHGLSAREEPSRVEAFLARNVRKIATPAGASETKNPETMTDEKWAEAREHFVAHCSACHGVDGRGNTAFGRNMYPKASDLSSGQTQGLSDGELFYIITNGIRFTGMPAFGDEDTPESIWHLVAFIRRLPDLSDEELKQMSGLSGEAVEEQNDKKPETGKTAVALKQRTSTPHSHGLGEKRHKH
ncbi:MAG: cytochrome c [Acidobacteriota bacterium]